MIKAYKAGVPGNGKPFPDGAKMAKIHWTPKKNVAAPGQPTVPGPLHDVDFMVKDSKRFADSGGWGYAVFKYDAAKDAYTPGTTADSPPQANDAKCGVGVPHDREEQGLRLHRVPAALSWGGHDLLGKAGTARRSDLVRWVSSDRETHGRF